MLTLTLARGWYAILGAAALVTAIANLVTAIQGPIAGWEFVAAGVLVGLLSLGAALWVRARSRLLAVLAWLGILALALVFVWPLTWQVDPLRDRIVFTVAPAAIAWLAAARMAWARAHTPTGNAGAVDPEDLVEDAEPSPSDQAG